jgi:predicted MFS family arabinose efflux permease
VTLTASRRRARRPRLVTPTFVLVGLASLAYFTADGVLIPTVPLYVEGPLRGDDVAVGLSVGAFSATALLLRPWAGRLADRRGRRILMVGGGGLVALSVAAYVVAGSVAALVALRLVTGVGEAFFFTGAASVVNDLAPDERRGEAVSFFSLALYVGIGLGPLAGEQAIRTMGFDQTWLIAAGAAVLGTILALGVPETRPQVEEGGPTSHRLIHPAALLPGTVLLTSVLGQAGFFAFLPLYSLDVGLEGSRFVFLMYSAIVVAIRSFGARIPDVLGPERTARTSLLCSAAGLAVAGLWATPVGVVLGTSIFAVGSSLAFPALMVLAVRGTSPGERGAVLGTFTAFVDLAFGAGPVTLGFVAAATGYGGTFLTAAAIILAGFALLVLRIRHRQPAPDEVA